MLQRIEYKEGEIIGNVIFLQRTGRSLGGENALFLCKCGNKFTSRITHVKSGVTKSCGCLQHPDLTGKKFGRLLVISENGRGKGMKRIWLCRCDCGNEKSIIGESLTSGHTNSCGCLKEEILKTINKTHGYSYKTEYRSWKMMKSRCLNPNFTDYKYWGGKGIKICDRWINSFENFLADMGNKPGPGYSLDRFPNKNGDYGPGNCRWGTDEQQSGNRENNIYIEYHGLRKLQQTWARELSTTPTNLSRMINKKGIDETLGYYFSRNRIERNENSFFVMNIN